jgi:hypothetical protein
MSAPVVHRISKKRKFVADGVLFAEVRRGPGRASRSSAVPPGASLELHF